MNSLSFMHILNQSCMFHPMGFPTLAQLCRSLPRDLRPGPAVLPTNEQITAVHVSELADPTPYLSGGEILLTTGLSLSENELGIRRYVGQLAEARVVALGVGLGPHLDALPPDLIAASAAAGVPLLVVPPESAFLTISKEYWAIRSRSSRQELSDALSAHSDLVEAMLSPDPTGAALRSLSTHAGAWTALFDEEAQVQQVYPVGRAHDSVELGQRLVAAQGAGTGTITTVPIRDEVAVVFPIVIGDRIRGHLSLASDAPIGPNARRLAITTTSLLSLDSVQRHRADTAAQTCRTVLASLLDLGHPVAAHRLGGSLDVAVPSTVRVLQLRTSAVDDAIAAVLRWCPEAWVAPQKAKQPGPTRVSEPWFIIPTTTRDISSLGERLNNIDRQTTGILSDTTPLTAVHGTRVGLADRAAALPIGTFLAPQRTRELVTSWYERLDSIATNSRLDVVPTLAAYLRHRGQWDPAAADLGIHRNTVRYRIGKIRELLGCDVDDPDVASQIWLHLRESGQA